MATFTAYISANTSGSGPGTTFPGGDNGVFTREHPDEIFGSPTTILIVAPDQFVGYFGSFVYDGAPGPLVGGQVDEIVGYSTFIVKSPEIANGLFPNQLAVWTADGGFYDANTVLKADTDKDFFRYIFKEDDTLNGSEFDDSLSGWAGSDHIFGNGGGDFLRGGKGGDHIWGGTGNDKEWGNGGKDFFYFLQGDDKDRIKDLNRKKDTVVIDKALAANFSELKDIAKQKKGNTVLKFGNGDQLTLQNVKVDDLKKGFFDFQEFVV